MLLLTMPEAKVDSGCYLFMSENYVKLLTQIDIEYF